jgi:hypothetical protein
LAPGIFVRTSIDLFGRWWNFGHLHHLAGILQHDCALQEELVQYQRVDLGSDQDVLDLVHKHGLDRRSDLHEYQ